MKKILLLLLLSSFFVTPAWAGTGVDYNDANCQGAWLMDVDEDPITDSSQNTNTGALKAAGEPDYATASNPAAYSTGYYVFDGIDDYINCGNNSSLELVSNFSVTAWLKTTSTDPNGILVKQNTSSPYNGWAVALGLDDGTIRVVTRGNWITSTGTIGIIGEWEHLAVVNDGTDTEFFFNGVSDSKIAQENPDQFTGDALIGATRTNDGIWDGDLDEISAFNRTLTSTEINDIMDNGLAPAGGARRRIIMVN